MMEISFIFVSKQDLFSKIVGVPIRAVTKSKYSHIAIKFEDCVIEAEFPKIHCSKVDAYDNERIERVLTFTVSEDKYKEVYEEIKAQVHKWYGIDDCIIGGLHDLFHIHLNGLDLKWTKDCSALGSYAALKLFPDLLAEGEEPCDITPEDLLELLSAREVVVDG